VKHTFSRIDHQMDEPSV